MFAVPLHNGPERRAFIRLPYETEIHGQFSDVAEGKVRVHNVSRTGLRLGVPAPVAPGTPATLSFLDVHVNGEPVTLGGRIVWARPHGSIYRAGLAIDHAGFSTLGAASEVFYAAVAGMTDTFPAQARK